MTLLFGKMKFKQRQLDLDLLGHFTEDITQSFLSGKNPCDGS